MGNLREGLETAIDALRAAEADPRLRDALERLLRFNEPLPGRVRRKW